MVWTHVFLLLALTPIYWVVDYAVRRDGLLHCMQSLGLHCATRRAVWLTLACVAAAYWLPWSFVSGHEWLAWFVAGIACMLAWKGSTQDIDPIVGNTFAAARCLAPLCALMCLVSPLPLIAVLLLLTDPLRVWQHHATMPMRMLQAVAAYVLYCAVCAILQGRYAIMVADESSTVAGDWPWWVPMDAGGLVFFLVIIQVSHYWITAFAKGWLGPHWYSWMIDNRLHHLAANAYSWGWAKFLPWSVWSRVVGITRRCEKPMQVFAFVLEAIAPLALLDIRIAMVLGIVWASFHVGIFLVSGLFFWEWIGTNLLLAMLLWFSFGADAAFGPWHLLIGIVYMVAFPLRHKLWKPMPLGWWDTPFTQRMHWIAIGDSGTEYGVYNSFMCPNERLYGKVHACFMSPMDGFTYHLGEVWKHDLRDAIRAAGPDADALDRVRETYGVRPHCETLTTNHLNYLRRFFFALNSGARKRVLPGWLWFCKAPGDQIFYWGDLPAYRRQEPVARVMLRYREEYFDGTQLQRIHDVLVCQLEIDASCGDLPCIPEPTPKEIDDLLLGVANGKIIDLPNFGDGYIRGDDGRQAAES